MFDSSENEILQTFFAKTGAALTISSTFASPEGTTVSHCHTINPC